MLTANPWYGRDLLQAPLKSAMPLGVPVACYVENNLVDTMTLGRHSLLRDVLCAADDDIPISPPSD